MDSEYAEAGFKEPKVCVTTSRDPSARLTQFAKEVRLMIPNCQKINRGRHAIATLGKYVLYTMYYILYTM